MIRSVLPGFLLLGALFGCACSLSADSPFGGQRRGCRRRSWRLWWQRRGVRCSASGASGGSGSGGAAGSAGAGATGGAAGVDAGGDVGVDTGVTDPGTEGDGDLPPISPPYADKNLDVRNVPHGTIYRFSMDSNEQHDLPGFERALHARCRSLHPQAVHGRHGGAIHRRSGRPGLHEPHACARSTI